VNLALYNRVVVLTGAASGIGAALVRSLLQRGAILALIDRDAYGLEAVADMARQNGGHVKTYVVDLLDQAAIASLPALVKADLGSASILVNNAGIALAGSFEQVTDQQFDRVIAINFRAPVAMFRAFLPQLRLSQPAQIVNLSSVFGLIGVPGQAAYCASKFAIRGFSEALRGELAGEGIGVTIVHPGGVRTNIAASADVGAGVAIQENEAKKLVMEKFLRMDAQVAAERIIKGLERREKRVIIGSDAKLLSFLQRLLPVSYSRLLPRV
jgi:short-subunit dehydrogenase